MENIKNSIQQKEAKFDLHEMFFSVTEDDSTIVTGNDTFVRISGYTRQEIVGQYHNIVRHPDMPRVVFKTFWDYLKANKPIAAYVKNMTKQGEYYWVFAVVFPFKDRYISIRIKPNTAIFTAIKEVYSKLSTAEKKLNIQETEALLSELLISAGYRDYDHFIIEALMSELLKRKELLLTDKSEDDLHGAISPLELKIQSLYSSSKILLDKYANWFEKIDMFNNVKSVFEEKALTLSALARDIVLLSLNASIASYRVDTYGETFGVLASDIRTNAKENDESIRQIDALSYALSDSLNEIIFVVSSISLQIEMVTYFLKELFGKSDDELNDCIHVLFELVHTYNIKLTELTVSMDKSIQKSLMSLNALEKQIMYLGYIQIYGIIESASTNDDSSGFNEIFTQLKALIAKISEEIELMKKLGEGFYKENGRLINESRQIEKMLNGLDNEIIDLKNIKG